MPSFTVTYPFAEAELGTSFDAEGEYIPEKILRELIDGKDAAAIKMWEELLVQANLMKDWAEYRKNPQGQPSDGLLRLVASLPLTCKLYRKVGGGAEQLVPDPVQATVGAYCPSSGKTPWSAHFPSAGKPPLSTEGEYRFEASLLNGSPQDVRSMTASGSALPHPAEVCLIENPVGDEVGDIQPAAARAAKGKRQPKLVLADYPRDPRVVAATCVVFLKEGTRVTFIRALSATPSHGRCEFYVPVPEDATAKTYFTEVLLLTARGAVLYHRRDPLR